VRLEAQAGQTLLGSLRPGTSLAKRRAPNPDAYELYLKARAYRGDGTVTAFEQAVAYLNQAIERDPDYADAYAALAGVYTSGAANFASHPLEYVDKAKAAAAKALELDSSSARALAAEGFIDGMRLLDWKKGEQELRESARLMPGSATTHNWLGLTLLMQGRFDEALAELRTAEKAEPLVAAPGVTVGLALYFARRYDDAVRQLTKVQTLFPDKIMVHNFTGLAWEGKGAYLKALAEYQLVSAQYPADVAGNLAHLYAEMGNSAQARALLARMEHPQPDQAPPAAFDIAVTYGALGDRDQAFEWLERAYDERKIEMLKVHPALDPLRDDPRYAALLRKAGLSQ